MRKSLFALVALLSTGVSASAADLGPYRSMKDAPVVAFVPLFSWTGFYIGAQVGYTWGSAEHRFEVAGVPGELLGIPRGNSDPDGFVGGGHIGYNWQSGQIVFGVEADFEGGDVDGEFVNLAGLTSIGRADLDWQGSVRGRLGYAADRTLFYFTAGWAFADVEFRGDSAPFPACCGFSDTLNGWTVGGGVEHAFTPNLTIRAEYRFTDFGEASGRLLPLMPAFRMPVDLETQTVRLGASYKW